MITTTNTLLRCPRCDTDYTPEVASTTVVYGVRMHQYKPHPNAACIKRLNKRIKVLEEQLQQARRDLAELDNE